jgi:hypothetical protein
MRRRVEASVRMRGTTPAEISERKVGWFYQTHAPIETIGVGHLK